MRMSGIELIGELSQKLGLTAYQLLESNKTRSTA